MGFYDQDTLSRRGFVKGSVLASAGLGAALSGLTGCAQPKVASSPAGDDGKAATAGSAANAETSGYLYDAEQQEGEWIHTACQRNCFDTA